MMTLHPTKDVMIIAAAVHLLFILSAVGRTGINPVPLPKHS